MDAIRSRTALAPGPRRRERFRACVARGPATLRPRQVGGERVPISEEGSYDTDNAGLACDAAYALHIMEEYTFDRRNLALLTAYPIVMLNLRSIPYFLQD
jgi:hypothetical protein